MVHRTQTQYLLRETIQIYTGFSGGTLRFDLRPDFYLQKVASHAFKSANEGHGPLDYR